MIKYLWNGYTKTNQAHLAKNLIRLPRVTMNLKSSGTM